MTKPKNSGRLVGFYIQPRSYYDKVYLETYEETLLIDEITLIGNLGGVLGMFLGFSIFGYVSTLFDYFINFIQPQHI